MGARGVGGLLAAVLGSLGVVVAGMVGLAVLVGLAGGLDRSDRSRCGTASPADPVALDAWMADKVPGSPLVGLGETFVAAGQANGIDPRALVAVAYHESVLGTAGGGAYIHNAFGWGPHLPFDSWQSNIQTVAAGLAGGYLGEGRDTLAEIQAKWAPLGVSNDPTNLNANWTAGVSAAYAELGGRPDGSIALAQAAAAMPASPDQPGPIAQAGPAPADGGDGQAPLSVAGLVFPVDGEVRFGDDYLGQRGSGSHCPGTNLHCAIDVFAAAGTPVLAPIAGTIVRKSSGGLGGNHLSVEADGQRFYLAHLRDFTAGLHDGLRVEAGQELGTVGQTGSAADTEPHLHLAWSHRLDDGHWITVNPYHLLLAARHETPIAGAGCAPDVGDPVAAALPPGPEVAHRGPLASLPARTVRFAAAPDYGWAEQLAQRFGLTVSSDKRTMTDQIRIYGEPRYSFHLEWGGAADFSGPPEAMAALAEWAMRSGLFHEVFYDPLGQVDGGHYSPAGIGGHSDHVHLSFGEPALGHFYP